MSHPVVSIGTAPGEIPGQDLAARRNQSMQYQNWGPQEITAPVRSELAEVPVERGMVLEDAQSGWVGAVTRVEKSGGMHVVALEDRRGKSRPFKLGFGFLLEGQPIRLMPPAPRAAPAGAGAGARTASGSVRVA